MEVIAVLIIIVVVSAVVVSRIVYSDIEQRGAAEVVKTHLRYAQARAMNTDASWGLKFDQGRYWLFKEGALDTPVWIPGQDQDTVTMPAGMSAAAVVSFDRLGRPAIDPVPQDGTSLSFGAGLPVVTVTPKTGFIP